MSTETPENLTLSSPEEIKKKRKQREQKRLLELPSGLVVGVKQVDIAVLLKEGVIPSSVLQQIDPDNPKETTDPVTTMKTVDAYFCATVVQPEVVMDSPTDAQVSVDDFTFEDKLFVLNQGGVEMAPESFREESNEQKSDRPDVQEVSRDAAKPDTKDKK